MRVLLLSVPVSDPTQPSLALPTLAAYLRKKHIEVDILDLSIEAFDAITSKDCLDLSIGSLKTSSVPSSRQSDENYRKQAATAFAIAPSTAEGVDRAKKVLRSHESFLNFPLYRQSIAALRNALSIVSASYFPTKVDFLNYETNLKLTSTNIKEHLTNPRANVFLQYFSETAIGRIKHYQPDVIGISVTYKSQFLPALTLIQLIKQNMPSVKIILGGAFITAISERLVKEDLIWEAVTAVVLYEGESVFSEIIERIAGSEGLAGLPNVLLPGIKEITNKDIRVENIDSLPTPDFTGIPIDLYLSPEPVLSLQTNRGCYWGKCAFCSVSRATRTTYRKRSIDLVLEDFHILNQKHGGNIFFICDDATPVKTMKSIAAHFIDNSLPFLWCTEARFEEELDKETCELLAGGGCLHLIFGFESGSDRVLSLMNKGTDISRIKTVLKACKDSSIAVNLQSFIGFPGEKMEDTIATETFFKSNRDLYTSIGIGKFLALEGSKVVASPGKYGVKLKYDDENELVPWHEVEMDEGMLPNQVQDRYKAIYENLVRDDFIGPGFLNGSTGAHGLLYIKQHGRKVVDKLGLERFSSPNNLEKTMYRINPLAEISHTIDNEGVIYERHGGHSLTLNPLAISAVSALKKKPQSITSVAASIYEFRRQEPNFGYEALGELLETMIDLIRMGLLLPVKSEITMDEAAI